MGILMDITYLRPLRQIHTGTVTHHRPSPRVLFLLPLHPRPQHASTLALSLSTSHQETPHRLLPHLKTGMPPHPHT